MKVLLRTWDFQVLAPDRVFLRLKSPFEKEMTIVDEASPFFLSEIVEMVNLRQLGCPRRGKSGRAAFSLVSTSNMNVFRIINNHSRRKMTIFSTFDQCFYLRLLISWKLNLLRRTLRCPCTTWRSRARHVPGRRRRVELPVHPQRRHWELLRVPVWWTRWL